MKGHRITETVSKKSEDTEVWVVARHIGERKTNPRTKKFQSFGGHCHFSFTLKLTDSMISSSVVLETHLFFFPLPFSFLSFVVSCNSVINAY